MTTTLTPQFMYYLQRLRQKINDTADLAGRFQLAAGILKSREIHNISANYSHFHHAESHALKKYCLLPGYQRKVTKG